MDYAFSRFMPCLHMTVTDIPLHKHWTVQFIINMGLEKGAKHNEASNYVLFCRIAPKYMIVSHQGISLITDL